MDVVADRPEKIATRWASRDARTMRKWDARIKVFDRCLAVNNNPRDPSWGTQIERWTNFIDKSRMWSIVQLRVSDCEDCARFSSAIAASILAGVPETCYVAL